MDTNAILFHSRRDPYGDFSNFSDHPIWIGGRLYRTVEHWYQASRAHNLDEHLWIRAAALPEEAKERGREVSRNNGSWPTDRREVMYRGVLAKFRQHPKLGELLQSTGEAELHEFCDDPFWGFNGVSGEDWLGRILMFVRSQLGDLASRSSIDKVPFLIGSQALRYVGAVSIRQKRNKGEAWLTHLVKVESEPEATLTKIVATKKLLATPQLSGCRAVCFTAHPMSILESLVSGPENSMRKEMCSYNYSPYGVAIRFDMAREMGFRPVCSVPPQQFTSYPTESRYLSQVYSAGDMFDYSHEDEWRYLSDIDLGEGPFAILVPGRDKSIRLMPTWLYSDSEILESIKLGHVLEGSS